MAMFDLFATLETGKGQSKIESEHVLDHTELHLSARLDAHARKSTLIHHKLVRRWLQLLLGHYPAQRLQFLLENTDAARPEAEASSTRTRCPGQAHPSVGAALASQRGHGECLC